MATTDNRNNVVTFPDAKTYRPSDQSELGLYKEQLKEFGLTQKQQREFLEALWIILAGFIDLGYGQHPTQRPEIPNDLNESIIEAVDEFFKNAA